MDLWT